jgi:hypothetical protein
MGTFSETHPLIGPRAKLTTRAVEWAIRSLAWDDTTVSALARHLGVDWHTLMDAIRGHATARIETPSGWPASRPSEWTSTSGGPVTGALASGRSPPWST